MSDALDRGSATGEATMSVGTDPAVVEWLTPGRCIARAVAGRPEVRYVLEGFDASGYSVYVVLHDDPEDLLDRVIDAERELYTRFAGTRFDVRVMKPDETWSEEAYLRNTVVLYQGIQHLAK